MIRSESNIETFKYIIFPLILLVANNFYSFIYYDGSALIKLLSIMMVGLGLYYFHDIRRNLLYNLKCVILLACILLLSFFTSYIYEEQTFLESFNATILYFACLSLYFILHKQSIRETEILDIFKILAFVYVIISLFQQLSPIWLFGMRNGEEIRMGLHRYSIYGDRLCFLPMFYYYSHWLKTSKSKDLLFSFFFLTGVLLTTERMLIAGAIGAYIIGFMMTLHKRSLVKRTFLIGILLLFLYVFALPKLSKLEGNLIEMTENQYERNLGNDDIRLISINYYLNVINDTWDKKLLGVGINGGHSKYSDRILNAEEQYGFYRVDIGIFGDISVNGIISVMVLFIMMLYILLNSTTPLYIKLTIILFLLSWILNSSIDMIYRFIMWPIIFYISDLHAPRKLQINKHLLNKFNR